LKAKYYIRYADDFVFLSASKIELLEILSLINQYLIFELKLELYSQKVYLKTLAQGVDFLGWVNFPNYKVLRHKTSKRMMTKIKDNPKKESLASYLGLLKHGNTFKLSQGFKNNYWLASDF